MNIGDKFVTGEKMRNVSTKSMVLLWLIGLFLILNSIAMRAYALAIRSTYAFVASGTVFYPLALTNLVLGLTLIVSLILGLRARSK